MATTQRASDRAEPSDVALVTKSALHRRVDELTDDSDLLEAARVLAQVGDQKPTPKERELIQRWIEPHPRGTFRARVTGAGVPVYAIAAKLGSSNAPHAQQVAQAAKEYDIPLDAARAALAYYRQHRYLIDAWNAMNAE